MGGHSLIHALRSGTGFFVSFVLALRFVWHLVSFVSLAVLIFKFHKVVVGAAADDTTNNPMAQEIQLGPTDLLHLHNTIRVTGSVYAVLVLCGGSRGSQSMRARETDKLVKCTGRRIPTMIVLGSRCP